MNNGAATLTFNCNVLFNSARAFNAAAGDIVINGVVSSLNTVGAGGITKTGPGRLALAGANVNSGPTTIGGGTLALATLARAASSSGGTCTLVAGNNFFTYTGTQLDGLTAGQAAFFPSLGSGLVNPIPPGTVITAVDAANKKIFLSANLVATTTTTAGHFGTPCGLGLTTAAATNLVFSGSSMLQYTGPTTASDHAFTINAGVTATIEVTNAATVLTLSGGTTATSGALAKTGPGTLTLTNAWLHTGGTTVAAGTLQLGGMLAAGCVVTNSALLTGAGVVNGPVTIAAGATLRPGWGGADTSAFTVNHTLTLAGTTLLAINRTNAANATTLTGITTLTRGGTLTVTNVGPALQAGDTFTLFSAASVGGAFAATNLPVLDAGLNWWTGYNIATVVDYSVNQAPVANDLSLVATSGILASLKIIGGDNPPTGEPGEILSIIGVTQPANGTAATDGTNVTFLSDGLFTGVNTFGYTVSDGRGGVATATVTVSVVNSVGGFTSLTPAGSVAGNTATLSYPAVPRYNVILDWATNRTAPLNWMPLATNTVVKEKLLSFTNTSAVAQGLFRTRFSAAPALEQLVITVTAAPYAAVPNDASDDSAAFQSALNALKAAGGGHLYIPDGNYIFSNLVAITAGTWFLSVQGQSTNATLFACNTNGVFRFTGLQRDQQITVRDLTFVANRAGAGTALEATSPPGGVQEKRVVTVANVVVRAGDSAEYYFNKGVVVTGVYRPLIMDCSFAMPTINDFGDNSMNFRSAYGYDVSACYAAVIQNCSASGVDTAFNYVVSSDISANPEDGAFRSCTADYCKVGVKHWEISGGREPTLWVTDCDIRARDFGTSVKGRRILQITDDTFRQLSATNALTDGTLASGRTNIVVVSPASDVILGSNVLSGDVSSAIQADPVAVRVLVY
ncbi:MAG: autotransporter-associated beta strand repeat-containing protein [Verrucomicrobia bacterium]|nr:autotransporter-associated beta strand repeat-containing protein [Verrucomicrobiota bacterium]